MAKAEHLRDTSNIVRFPEPGGTNVYPNGSGVGLEIYIAGIFAGLIRLKGDVVLAYRNDFGSPGAFPTIDAATRAVSAGIAT